MEIKIFYLKKRLVAILVLAVLFTACVNSIGEEEELLQAGTVPISFTGKVSKVSVTRVTDKALEQGDKIGLMAMADGAPLSGRRYIDNLLLTTAADNVLTPETTVYYPDGEGASLDFIAYYPYRAEGIPTGSSCLTVSVKKDQTVAENWDQSDFLVASKTKVKSSSHSVPLSFKHKLAKVKVELVPTKAEDIETLLEGNPTIKASGFYTQATYDFSTDQFSELAVPGIIQFSGDWKKSGNKLVGKEMIVVPQTMDPEKQYIALEYRGKLYTCRLSSNVLNSNSQRVITIQFSEVEDHTLTGIVGTVEDWGDGTVQEEQSESAYQMQGINVELLTFIPSNIYRIYGNGTCVAEVCKEYLRLPESGIDSQAFVVYPVKSGNADLSQGTVLQLLDVKENVHGGKVLWNVQDHTAQYTPGSSAPIDVFYIDEDGNIVLQKPEKMMPVQVKSYELRDIRGPEMNLYPLVKIGTQYWMRENLHTNLYADGTQLKLQTSTGNGSGYFCTSEKDDYFYNGEALKEGNLAPNEWRIPKVVDWEILCAYVGDMAALKVGKWDVVRSSETLAPVSNRSFFYGKPVGMWMKSACNQSKLVGYWSLNEDGTDVAEQTLFLAGEYASYKLTNTKQSGEDFYKAISIRCIRK